MHCYLKVSLKNRHKKYKYRQDKSINLHQIRKDLNLAQEKPMALLISHH